MQGDPLFQEELHLVRGFQLGDYTLLGRIGYGGEGAVWSGWDNRRRRVVALKVMAAPAEDDFFASQISSDFERQVHLLASLDHPNILPLYEFGMTDQYYYFAMKYSCAGSLANRLLAGPLPLQDALRVTAQIASALSYIHQRAIVHRDLKPSNILLDGQDRVYLSDFGIAKRLVQETAPLHTGRGTGPYAPYEQHIPSLMTPQSDVYSLGVMVYEMLAGQLPWGGISDLAIQQYQGNVALPDVQEVNPQLPFAMTDVLRKMTAFDWQHRPASAAQALDLIIETLPGGLKRNATELRESLPRLDETELIAHDASYLLKLFLPGWRSETEAFPASLTNLALIDSAYMADEKADGHRLPLDDEQLTFMLRGALALDYRSDYWWQQVADPLMRAQVCAHTIATEDDATIGRALTYLAREPAGVLTPGTFSATTLEHLVNLAIGAKGWSLRNHALKALERTVPRATQWQPASISAASDTKLATLALGDSSQARQAARLIGQMHSEAAVKELIEARDGTGDPRLMELLREVRTSAGSLPGLVPAGLRLRVIADLLREQLLEDREGLSWSRALLGLLVGLTAALMMLLGLLSRPSAQMRDVLLEPYPVSNILTMVEVNDASLERFGRWDNWPRSLHAEMIDRLNAAGARAIVFDFIFASPTAEDAVLEEAMQRAGNVIQPVLGQGDAFHDVEDAVRYESRVLPQPDLVASAAALGHTNILHDADGYVRRVPTVIEAGGERHLSLALAAVQTFLGMTQDPETNLVPMVTSGYLEVAGRRIPVGDLGDMSIYYAGPPSQPGATTYQTVSYQDVLDQEVSADLFRDKIVLIGMTATAEPDRYLTPVSRGRPMYGVEILANVIESVWSGRFITQPGRLVQGVILLLLGIVTGLICTRPWSGLLLAMGTAALYFVAAAWLFELRGLMLDLLFPFLTIAFSYATVTAYRFSIEVRRRREIMQLFQSRVTPEVAQATIEAVKKGEISLGGRVQEVSVLLADIRGYASFAELHEPEEALEVMKTLRDIMVEEVFAYEGTLAQVEGEFSMAIFNAPLPQGDHAWRAVEAALAIKARIEAYHYSLPSGHPHRLVDFGYGAHTGRAIVGHTGSSERYTYTAIGSAVNIASQLARTAKPGQLIVGQATYEMVKDVVIADPLPLIPVKDEPAPIEAYSVARRTDHEKQPGSERILAVQ